MVGDVAMEIVPGTELGGVTTGTELMARELTIEELMAEELLAEALSGPYPPHAGCAVTRLPMSATAPFRA